MSTDHKLLAAQARIKVLEQQRDELMAALEGALVVIERLRTSKETQFTHSIARDGAMVYVQATIAALFAVISKVKQS